MPAPEPTRQASKTTPAAVPISESATPTMTATAVFRGSCVPFGQQSSWVASPRQVFAHYFPQFPISIDNQPASSDYYTAHYLNPEGEGGKFRAVGGWLRDRPLPRTVSSSPTWRVDDLRREVQQAKSAGIDGFAVDIMELSGNGWRVTTDMLVAAQTRPGFKIMLQPDMSAAIGGVDQETLARAMSQLAKSGTVARTPDGRVIISPFMAEKHSVDWWKQFLTAMQRNGQPAALLPLFVDPLNNMEAFAPISYAMSEWGVRDPYDVKMRVNFAAKAHALGVKWMAPLAVQDQRTAGSVYWEAGNTETLRGTYQRAISDGADMAMAITWNDYGESSGFAPSVNHGYAFMDMLAYGIEWFKSGRQPGLQRDALYLTHRPMLSGTKPTLQTQLMQQQPSTATRDTVEVVSMLTAPATVSVNVGGRVESYDAPAGVSAKTFPLSVGGVTASATRGGQNIATVTTPTQVAGSVARQDFSYHAASSRCS